MVEQTEVEVPLLPFGETLRPLLLASSLSGSDLRFVLQRRGIYVKNGQRESTIPNLTSILLSPREFDILKNRQHFKENTVKVSDAKTTWNSTKTVLEALPAECEPFVKKLVDENSPYQLTDCKLQVNSSNEVVFNCSIKRQDWTKDAFSSTSFHECKLIISKDNNSNIVTYRTETTIPETKDLMNKLQTSAQSYFKQQGAIAQESKIQKVLANYFVSNAVVFQFLYWFIEQSQNALCFERITDIDAGIDHKNGQFPDNFLWLKNNIDKMNLHGDRLQSTDIMKLGELGVLIFGEIEAEFKFSYQEAQGKCIIRYGFPDYYVKKRYVEFEAKVISLTLFPAYAHVSKERVNRYLIQEFQKNKHQVFEQFISQGKADTQKRDFNDQYEFDFFEDEG
jgi:hypothetical protein